MVACIGCHHARQTEITCSDRKLQSLQWVKAGAAESRQLLTAAAQRAMNWVLSAISAMSEEQLSAFLTAVKDDAELKEKLKGAADLDAAVALAKEAGFDVCEADWLRHQAKQTLELSDEELEDVAGGWEHGTGCAQHGTVC
jgi:predicted ribosomally synthesized peptide with nif11-like leader